MSLNKVSKAAKLLGSKRKNPYLHFKDPEKARAAANKRWKKQVADKAVEELKN